MAFHINSPAQSADRLYMQPETTPQLEKILRLAADKQASDIHLKAGVMPVIRKLGKLRPIDTQMPPLDDEQIKAMLFPLLNEKQIQSLQQGHEVDMGHGISGLGRYRFNIFQQRGSLRAVVRSIPHSIPTFEALSLPKQMEKISSYERGLVLVTGATGSGKSSTMAAMIDYINSNKNKHIITIEDPIEFLIRDKKSIITQRELGLDAISYAQALKSSLRQDPDVILIGEMRDLETIETALIAAETGHLVLSTLHTLDAKEAINRILSVFESHRQMQIRYQLAGVLKAVISQRLAPKKSEPGFIPAIEIMINNARIQEMIVQPDRTHNIPRAIEEGSASYGMQSFDQSLAELVVQQLVDYNEALQLATNPEDFAIQFSGISKDGKKWRSKGRTATMTHKELDIEVESITEARPLKKKK